MRNGKTSEKLQWLLYPESGEPLPVALDQRPEIRGDGWSLRSERFAPRPGLLVFMNRLRAERPFVLEPAKEPGLDPHQIHSTLVIRGRAHLTTLDQRHFDLSPHRALCYTISGEKARFDIPAGEEVVSFGMTLVGGAAFELLAERMPDGLKRLVKGGSRQSDFVGWKPTPRVRAIARSAFDAPYEGPLREMYIEGIALQLLALQAAALGEQQEEAEGAALSRKERGAIHAAREQLLSDMRRPPSLGALALAVGLSSKRLNEGFRASYGATVFEVLRTERLEQARLAMSEAEDVPLKELAWRVGYSHVTNFSAAFARHFGEAPGMWRKRARRAS